MRRMTKKRRGSERQTPHAARSPLATFMLGAYLDWQRTHGAARSQVEFAEYLGLKVPTLTKIMRGGVEVPSRDTVEKIADKCGLGIYDALGIDRPDPLLAAIVAGWGELSLEQQEAIARSLGINTVGAFVGRSDRQISNLDASGKAGARAPGRVRTPHKS